MAPIMQGIPLYQFLHKSEKKSSLATIEETEKDGSGKTPTLLKDFCAQQREQDFAADEFHYWDDGGMNYFRNNDADFDASSTVIQNEEGDASTEFSFSSSLPLFDNASPRLTLDESGRYNTIMGGRKEDKGRTSATSFFQDPFTFYDFSLGLGSCSRGSEVDLSTEVLEDDSSDYNIPVEHYSSFDDNNSVAVSSCKYPQHDGTAREETVAIETYLIPTKALSDDSSSSRTPSDIRYSLKHGRKVMSDAERKATESKIRSLGKDREREEVPGTMLMLKSPRDYDVKIFLLLLDPKSKTFEIIQLKYSSIETTVHDLLKMIPFNATQDALGNQKYIGLCRPKEAEEIIDLDLFASSAGEALDQTLRRPHVDIKMGELLVAIPYSYTGNEMILLSRQILENPKIRKLMKRADPLKPKKKKKKSHNKKDKKKKAADSNSSESSRVKKECAESSSSTAAVLDRTSKKKSDKYRKQINSALSKAVEAAAQASDGISTTSVTSAASEQTEMYRKKITKALSVAVEAAAKANATISTANSVASEKSEKYRKKMKRAVSKAVEAAAQASVIISSTSSRDEGCSEELYSENMNIALSKAVEAAAQANAGIIPSATNSDEQDSLEDNSKNSFNSCLMRRPSSASSSVPSLMSVSYDSKESKEDSSFTPWLSKAIEAATEAATKANCEDAIHDAKDSFKNTSTTAEEKTSNISSSASVHSVAMSSCESHASGFTSWTKSIDTSLAKKRMAARRQREEQGRKTLVVCKGSAAVLSYMIIHYLVHPLGFACSLAGKRANAALGFVGILQVVCLFALMVKFQTFIGPRTMSENRVLRSLFDFLDYFFSEFTFVRLQEHEVAVISNKVLCCYHDYAQFQREEPKHDNEV